VQRSTALEHRTRRSSSYRSDRSRLWSCLAVIGLSLFLWTLIGLAAYGLARLVTGLLR